MQHGISVCEDARGKWTEKVNIFFTWGGLVSQVLHTTRCAESHCVPRRYLLISCVHHQLIICACQDWIHYTQRENRSLMTWQVLMLCVITSKLHRSGQSCGLLGKGFCDNIPDLNWSHACWVGTFFFSFCVCSEIFFFVHNCVREKKIGRETKREIKTERVCEREWCWLQCSRCPACAVWRRSYNPVACEPLLPHTAGD